MFITHLQLFWKSYLTTAVEYGTYLLVLSLIWQTHYILIPDANQYAEIRLYGFDIIWFILCLLFLLWYRFVYTKQPNWSLFLLAWLLLGTVAYSSYWADSRQVSLYYLIHLGMAMITMSICYMAPLRWDRWCKAMVLTGLIEAIIITWQFIHQVIQPNKWLGIAQQLPELAGTPVILTFTERFLRAFGTWPHPNSAAGWIVLCCICTVWLWQNIKTIRWRWLYYIAMIIESFGLLLTFSRSALLVWLIICVSIIIWERKLWPIIATSIATLICLTIIYNGLLAPRITVSNYVEHFSLEERQAQIQTAIHLLPRYWIQGTGIGNYTITTSADDHLTQPVHNILLLLLIETGVFFCAVFIYFLMHSFIGINWKNQWAISVVLFNSAILMLGMLDHYAWTLPSFTFIWFMGIGWIYRAKRV